MWTCRTLALLTAVLALTGCQTLFGGINAKTVAVSAQTPANVAVYIEVKNGDEAVGGLTPSDFKVYENDKLLPSGDVQLTLLEKSVASYFHTVLLVDASNGGSPALAKAAAGFVTNLRRSQDVSVYVYDGAPLPKELGYYPRNQAGTTVALPVLAGYKARDASRDLNGSVMEALGALEKKLKGRQVPVRIGTLVVFTQGPDLANRAKQEDLDAALGKTPFSVYAIGIEPKEGETAPLDLATIGRAGVIRAQDPNTIDIAFEAAASKVADDADRFYLVAYCSPSRAGVNVLKVEVTAPTGSGGEGKGSVEVKFNASGFGPGCQASTRPRFEPLKGVPKESKGIFGINFLGGDASQQHDDGPPEGGPETTEPAPPRAPAPVKPAPTTPAPAKPAPETPDEREEGDGDGDGGDDIVPPPSSPRYGD